MKSAKTILRAAWIAGLCAGLSGARAEAQSAAAVSTARDLFIEASKLAEQGRWTEARERYERSLQLKRAAITLYSLGVAQKHTGKLVEALASFRAFVAQPSSAATKPYEEPAREAVLELEKRVARIGIAIEPVQAKGALVLIDGVTVPPAGTGQAHMVNPGAHVVVAHAPGFHDAHTTVTLAEGARATVKLVLVRDPTATGDSATAWLPAPPSAASGAPVAVTTAPSRVLPIAMIGGGVAVLAAGVTLGLLGVTNASQASSRQGGPAEAARSLALAGDVLAGVGLAAAAAGGIVFWARSPSAPSRAATVSPWIGPTSAGIRGTF